MLFKKLITSLLILSCISIHAQDKYIDSLCALVKKAKHDTVALRLMNDIAVEYSNSKYDSALSICDRVITLSNKRLSALSPASKEHKIYSEFLANAYACAGPILMDGTDRAMSLLYLNRGDSIYKKLEKKINRAALLVNLGNFYFASGDMYKTEKLFLESLSLSKESGNSRGEGDALNSLGSFYKGQGQVEKALDHFGKSILIHEKNKDAHNLSSAYSNMGGLYIELSETAKAMEYLEKALKLRAELGDKKGEAIILVTMAGCYKGNKDFQKKLELCMKSLELFQQIGMKLGETSSYSLLGGCYAEAGDNVKAMDSYDKSYRIAEQVGFKKGMASAALFKGITNISMDRTNDALQDLLLCTKLAKEIKSPDFIAGSAFQLTKVYRKKGDYKNSLEAYEIYIRIRDSLRSEGVRKAAIRKQFELDYQIKAAADSVKADEEKKIVGLQLMASESKLAQEKTQRIALYGGLALMLVFSGFIFNRFKVTQKQKLIIEAKEKETQKQNEVISHQKHLVDEKQQEILDSIRYARRIQLAQIPTEKRVAQILSRMQG